MDRPRPHVHRVIGSFAVAAATLVAGVAATSGLGTPRAAAQSTTPAPIIVDDTCSLWSAVDAANTAASTGGCENPDGSRTIRIVGGPTTRIFRPVGSGTVDVQGVVLRTEVRRGPTVGGAPTVLPEITEKITIEGADGVGIYMIAPNPTTRLAAVGDSGSLTLRNLTIAGFTIVGTPSRGCDVNPDGSVSLFCPTGSERQPAGDVEGGVIWAQGPLELDRVTMIGNRAVGGSSGFDQTTIAGRFAPKSAGSAHGGAVYANDLVTITDSVFSNNAAVGGTGASGSADSHALAAGETVGDGGDGGDALGGDISVKTDNTGITIRISNTIFESSRATAGSGGYGFTSDAVKAGERHAPATTGTTVNAPARSARAAGRTAATAYRVPTARQARTAATAVTRSARSMAAPSSCRGWRSCPAGPLRAAVAKRAFRNSAASAATPETPPRAPAPTSPSARSQTYGKAIRANPATPATTVRQGHSATAAPPSPPSRRAT